MVFALDKVVHVDGHIVTQIVKTELVVGTEGDVAVIRSLTGVAVRLMLVDAVHGQTMEHVQRSHPLGVSLGEVVVDCDDMDSLASQSVEEDRQGRHEGLSLSGRHLGDASHLLLVGFHSPVKDDSADQLDVIMDHVPGHLVASGHPVVAVHGLVAFDGDKVVVDAQVLVELSRRNLNSLVLFEPACGGFHDGESLREDLLKDFLDLLILFLDELVRLCRKILLLGDGNILL